MQGLWRCKDGRCQLDSRAAQRRPSWKSESCFKMDRDYVIVVIKTNANQDAIIFLATQTVEMY